MKRFTSVVAASLFLAIGLPSAKATDVWLDQNGTTPDSGVVSQAYNWTTNGSGLAPASWNTDSTGGAAGTISSSWVNNDFAHLAAGGDSNGVAYRLNLDATGVTLGGLEVEEGNVILSGSPVTLNTNPARIDNGATLEIPGLSNVVVTTGQVLTIDGGTLRNTIVGLGSGQWGSGASGTIAAPNAGTRIELTSAGGTIDTPNTGGAYSIMSYGSNLATSVVGMTSGTTSAKLTKTGPGEFRGLNLWTFTALDVQGGLYRINGTGGSDTGFGAVTGTVTTHGGATPNTITGTSLGTSITITSPATRSFVFNNDLGPDTMIVLNAGWTINGNISGPGGLMLNGWTRSDISTAASLIGSQGQNLTLGGTNSYGGATTINFGTLVVNGGHAIPDTSSVVFSTNSTWGNGTTTTLNTAAMTVNASETVGSLAGGNAARGSVNINGPTVALTTGADNLATTFSGAITGTGSLIKTDSGTFTMDGTKSYTGNTTVSGGTLSTNTAYLADAADVLLSTGSIFDLNTAGATDVIHSLFIDSVLQSAGVWGAIGSGAAHTSALITGSGFLNASVGASACAPGDFNCDGHVDAGDFVSIRKQFSDVTTGGGLTAYNAWRTNYGNPPGAGSGLGVGAVPEPTSLGLLMIGLAAFGLGRRNRVA